MLKSPQLAADLTKETVSQASNPMSVVLGADFGDVFCVPS